MVPRSKPICAQLPGQLGEGSELAAAAAVLAALQIALNPGAQSDDDHEAQKSRKAAQRARRRLTSLERARTA